LHLNNKYTHMKIHSVLILSGLLVFTASAFARLGETRDEIDKRYGQGTRSDIQRLEGAETFKYQFNDFQVEVVFHDNKSIWEIFHQGHIISTRDIKMLLKANTDDGHVWQYRGMNHRWVRSGSPQASGYLWPGHEDFFCIEDVSAVAAIQNSDASETGGF
jgi:hypothetical protein